MLYLVSFYEGTGDGPIMLSVSYFAEFLRDLDGLCAFCHGDPCAENSHPSSLISKYYAKSRYAVTCPCCDGRPS